MNANAIIGITAALVGCVVGLIVYMQQGKDAGYLARSKWDITLAEDGTAQTWYVDVATESVRVETVDDGGELRVQEFIGGRMYDFSLAGDYEPMDVDAFCTELGTGGEDDYGNEWSSDVDCEALAAQLGEDTQALWEANAGTKRECNVQDLDGFAPSEAVVENGEIVVGGFHVLMTDGVPTAIMDDEGSTIATINSIEDWAGELDISGCTVDDSRKLDMFEIIGESRRRRTTVDSEAEAARDNLNGMYMEFFLGEREPEETGRRLCSSLQSCTEASFSRSNWCGSGTDMIDTPCPNDGDAADGFNGNFDKKADKACRRHDHGMKAVGNNMGAVTLGCDIDQELIKGSPGNVGTNAAFGTYGLAAAWGCYDIDESCSYVWKNPRKQWRGMKWACETKEKVKNGYSRFNDIKHHYGYGYCPKTDDNDGGWTSNGSKGVPSNYRKNPLDSEGGACTAAHGDRVCNSDNSWWSADTGACKKNCA